MVDLSMGDELVGKYGVDILDKVGDYATAHKRLGSHVADADDDMQSFLFGALRMGWALVEEKAETDKNLARIIELMQKSAPKVVTLNLTGVSYKARQWVAQQWDLPCDHPILKASEDPEHADTVDVHPRILDEIPILTWTFNWAGFVAAVDSEGNGTAERFVELLLRHIDDGDLLYGVAILVLFSTNLECGHFMADVSASERAAVLELSELFPQVVSYKDVERSPGEPRRAGVISIAPSGVVITDAGSRVHQVARARLLDYLKDGARVCWIFQIPQDTAAFYLTCLEYPNVSLTAHEDKMKAVLAQRWPMSTHDMECAHVRATFSNSSWAELTTFEAFQQIADDPNFLVNRKAQEYTSPATNLPAPTMCARKALLTAERQSTHQSTQALGEKNCQRGTQAEGAGSGSTPRATSPAVCCALGQAHRHRGAGPAGGHPHLDVPALALDGAARGGGECRLPCIGECPRPSRGHVRGQGRCPSFSTDGWRTCGEPAARAPIHSGDVCCGYFARRVWAHAG
jgi:hypothetical protein